jgi:hypothetical protein
MNHPPCPQCGTPIERRLVEAPSKYLRRTHCPDCAAERRRRAGRNGLRRSLEAFADHRQALIEDLEWIIDTDSPEHVAQRLGYANADNLSRVLYRWGRNDLAARLDRRVA